MKSKLIIEKMPKRELTSPCREWRVVWRQCTQRGLSNRSFELIEQNLTRPKATHVFKRAKFTDVTHG